MDGTNNFETFPGKRAEVSSEQLERASQWKDSMAEGVPEFRGDKFGVANSENNYYGEAKDEEANNNEGHSNGSGNDYVNRGGDRYDAGAVEGGEEYDAGIADAAALINYGLDAAARELGVEMVVQKIKSFDAAGREDPVKDLFGYLGVDTPEERQIMQEENRAIASSGGGFGDRVDVPSRDKSTEGAFQAIEDMKELIAEVEGADPRYDELRRGAWAAGKGYFEYAVDGFGVRGLSELFQVLASQKERVDASSQIDEDKDRAGTTALMEGEEMQAARPILAEENGVQATTSLLAGEEEVQQQLINNKGGSMELGGTMRGDAINENIESGLGQNEAIDNNLIQSEIVGGSLEQNEAMGQDGAAVGSIAQLAMDRAQQALDGNAEQPMTSGVQQGLDNSIEQPAADGVQQELARAEELAVADEKALGTNDISEMERELEKLMKEESKLNPEIVKRQEQ